MPIVQGIAAAIFFLREAAGLGGFYVGAVLIELTGQVWLYPPISRPFQYGRLAPVYVRSRSATLQRDP